jgi:hypothetical protein
MTVSRNGVHVIGCRSLRGRTLREIAGIADPVPVGFFLVGICCHLAVVAIVSTPSRHGHAFCYIRAVVAGNGMPSPSSAVTAELFSDTLPVRACPVSRTGISA